MFFCIACETFWDMKKKLMSRLLHSTIHHAMWYFLVFIVNPISLLSGFFSSRKLYLLWSPCHLLIAESISLDTTSKPAVGFFLEITPPSSLKWSISLDELNSIDSLLKSWWWIFLKYFLFIAVNKLLLSFFGEFIWILFFEYCCRC